MPRGVRPNTHRSVTNSTGWLFSTATCPLNVYLLDSIQKLLGLTFLSYLKFTIFDGNLKASSPKRTDKDDLATVLANVDEPATSRYAAPKFT